MTHNEMMMSMRKHRRAYCQVTQRFDIVFLRSDARNDHFAIFDADCANEEIAFLATMTVSLERARFQESYPAYVQRMAIEQIRSLIAAGRVLEGKHEENSASDIVPMHPVYLERAELSPEPR